jgi:hypothetical protein
MLPPTPGDNARIHEEMLDRDARPRARRWLKRFVERGLRAPEPQATQERGPAGPMTQSIAINEAPRIREPQGLAAFELTSTWSWMRGVRGHRHERKPARHPEVHQQVPVAAVEQQVLPRRRIATSPCRRECRDRSRGTASVQVGAHDSPHGCGGPRGKWSRPRRVVSDFGQFGHGERGIIRNARTLRIVLI